MNEVKEEHLGKEKIPSPGVFIPLIWTDGLENVF